jgi:hypothetical protein
VATLAMSSGDFVALFGHVQARPSETRSNAYCDRDVKKFHFFAKKSLLSVDALFSTATLLTPPEAGLPLVARRKELVLAFFGTANWNSILSRPDETVTRLRWARWKLSGRRSDWVFLWCGRGVNRWFFDIYIQGSKNNF